MRFNIFRLPRFGCLAAVAALSQKFKKMTAYLKTRLSGKPAFQLAQVAIGKIDDPAAVGTDQVMMMLRRSAYQVAPAIPPGVHLANKTEFGKNSQGAVNGHQPDAGVLKAYPLVYG
jgi:hypothetical protein